MCKGRPPIVGQPVIFGIIASRMQGAFHYVLKYSVKK